MMAEDKDLESDLTIDPEKEPETNNAPSNALTKIISRTRSRASAQDPGPPPDGGWHAWLQAIAVHCIIFNTWGYINSYGVFQTYYVEALGRPPSDISWVGSFQIWLTFLIGVFSGRALDGGYFKPVAWVGSLLILVGVFMTSVCTQYWQFFLAQGLCQGIGSGLIFCPAMALLATYFTKNRALAIGVAACGNATGGLVFPAIFQGLLPRIGFSWTLRVIGLIILVLQTGAVLVLKTRIPPRQSGPLFEWAAFKEMPYTLFCFGNFMVIWGAYIPHYYVGSYLRNILHATQVNSINVLLILNGVGIPGRLIAAFAADHWTGPLNLLLFFNFTSSVLVYSWIAVKTEAGLYIFAILYGFFCSGILTLFPATLAALTLDLQKMGSRVGMCFGILSFATLTGPPIAGALITKANGSFLYAQIFAATALLGGMLTLVGCRVSKTGWKLKVKM